MSFFHPKKSKTDALLLIATLLFALVEFFGDGWTFFIQNSRCFAALGCNAGFFGYDAIIHIFGGIFFSIFIAWIIQRRPRLNILHAEFWKSALVILGLIALASAAWELYEYTLDYLNILTVHTNVSYVDTLAQPGLADTIGDTAFELLGALFGVFLLHLFDSRALCPRGTNASDALTKK